MTLRPDRAAVLLAAVLLPGHPWAGTASAAAYEPPPAECPQPRLTGKAPEPVYGTRNPLTPSRWHLEQGRRLYREHGEPVSCVACHGEHGDGRGPLACGLDPPPRNFRCRSAVAGVPDGQLFWIIRNGSPGTLMPGYTELTDLEIWQLVLYLRRLVE